MEDITPEGDLRSSMSVYSTPQEFAHALEKSGALETQRRETIVSAVELKPSQGAAIITERIYSDDGYFCTRELYVKCKAQDGAPTAFAEVMGSNLRPEGADGSLVFLGELFCGLESDRRLHWDINGDFFLGGEQLVSGGGSAAVVEFSTLNFEVAQKGPWAAYLHDTRAVNIARNY